MCSDFDIDDRINYITGGFYLSDNSTVISGVHSELCASMKLIYSPLKAFINAKFIMSYSAIYIILYYFPVLSCDFDYSSRYASTINHREINVLGCS